MRDNDDSQTLQETVKEALATHQPLHIRGGNTRAFLGREVKSETELDTRNHSGIVLYEPAELAITVRSGTPLAELEGVLAAENQQLPFEPPRFDPASTIGGAIATGLAGPRRPYNGAVRDSLLGVKLINGKGEILQFGGQVMKNVAGYDLSRPMAGAFGTLGLLLEVSLKLKPVPPAEIALVKSLDKAAALEELQLLHREPGNLSATAWLDGKLYLRLSGFGPAIEARAAKLGGERLDDDEAERFWTAIRDHQHDFFAANQPLWRLAVKPASGELDLPGDELIEWAGGQRWLHSEAPPEQIRAIAEKAGGHATLFRAPEPLDEPFHPLSPGLMTLHRQLKEALDPAGIFNPGKMYADL